MTQHSDQVHLEIKTDNQAEEVLLLGMLRAEHLELVRRLQGLDLQTEEGQVRLAAVRLALTRPLEVRPARVLPLRSTQVHP
jgi:hypothetical protein